MCGLYGSLGFNSNALPSGLLHHRGPDHIGNYSDDNVSLFHTVISQR